MRLCQCGGQVKQGQLTEGRESWSCKVCGRYEIFQHGENMNRKDIIRMAQEAGFFIQQNEIYSMSTQSDQELTEWIEHFAALVASAEREACAKVVENILLAEGADVDDVLLRLAEDIRARGQA